MLLYLHQKSFNIIQMNDEKEIKQPDVENIPDTGGSEQEQPRPNRDQYSQMWSEDNDDVDFEDKEARYGRAIEDRKELRERRKADASLGDIFDRHNWLAIMYSELRDNPDMDVFEWLEGFCNENDLSIQEVLDNPEAKKRLSEKIATRQQEDNDKKAKSEETQANIEKSYSALKDAFPDKSQEEIDELWLGFWKIVEQAEQGIVDTKTMQDFAHSLTYDDDIKSAREEGGMQARNEKIQNKVRKPSEEMATLPPTLSQGAGAPTVTKTPKKKSFAKTVFEDID